jgi:hypothetical protein
MATAGAAVAVVVCGEVGTVVSRVAGVDDVELADEELVTVGTVAKEVLVDESPVTTRLESRRVTTPRVAMARAATIAATIVSLRLIA